MYFLLYFSLTTCSLLSSRTVSGKTYFSVDDFPCVTRPIANPEPLASKNRYINLTINAMGAEYVTIPFWKKPIDSYIQASIEGVYPTGRTLHLFKYDNTFSEEKGLNDFYLCKAQNVDTKEGYIIFLTAELVHILNNIRMLIVFMQDKDLPFQNYYTHIHLRVRQLPPLINKKGEEMHVIPANDQEQVIVPCLMSNLKNWNPDQEFLIYYRSPAISDDQANIAYSGRIGKVGSYVHLESGGFVDTRFDAQSILVIESLRIRWNFYILFKSVSTSYTGEYYCVRRDKNVEHQSKHYMLDVHRRLRDLDKFDSAAQYVFRGKARSVFKQGYMLSHFIEEDKNKLVPNSPLCYMLCQGYHALPLVIRNDSIQNYKDCVKNHCAPSVHGMTVDNLLVRRTLAKKSKSIDVYETVYDTQIYNAFRVERPTMLADFEDVNSWDLLVWAHKDTDHPYGSFWVEGKNTSITQDCLKNCVGESKMYKNVCLSEKRFAYSSTERSCIDLCIDGRKKRAKIHYTEGYPPEEYISRNERFNPLMQYPYDENKRLSYSYSQSLGKFPQPIFGLVFFPHSYGLENRDMYESCLPLDMLAYDGREFFYPYTIKIIPMEFIFACIKICDGKRGCGDLGPRLDLSLQGWNKNNDLGLNGQFCIKAWRLYTMYYENDCLRMCLDLIFVKLANISSSECGYRNDPFHLHYFDLKNYYYHPGYESSIPQDPDILERETKFLLEHRGTIYRKENETAVFHCEYPEKLEVSDGNSKVSELEAVAISFRYIRLMTEYDRFEIAVKILDVYLFEEEEPPPRKSWETEFHGINFQHRDNNMFKNTARAYHEDKHLYVILDSVNKSYEGLYECIVYYGDLQKELTISTILKTFPTDRYADAFLLDKPEYRYVVIEEDQPLAFLFEHAATENPVKDIEWQALVQENPKQLQLIAKIHRNIEHVANLNRSVDEPPSVTIESSFHNEYLPTYVLMVNSPIVGNPDAVLLKRLPKVGTALHRVFYHDWQYFIINLRDGPNVGLLTRPTKVLTLSWTDEYLNPYYEPLVHWHVMFMIHGPQHDKDFQPAMSYGEPLDSTACYALCTSLHVRHNSELERLNYEHCLLQNNCKRVKALSYQFNNMVTKVIEDSVNKGISKIQLMFYNGVNRMHDELLKPVYSKHRYLAAFKHSVDTNRQMPDSDKPLGEGLGRQIVWTVDGSTVVRECSSRCGIPLHCVTHGIQQKDFECFYLCLDNSTTDKSTESKPRLMTYAETGHDRANMFTAIPAMNRLYYDKHGYVAVLNDPRLIGSDANSYRKRCRSYEDVYTFMFHWHRVHSPLWTEKSSIAEDYFYNSDSYAPVVVFDKIIYPGSLAITNILFSDIKGHQLYGVPLVQNTKTFPYVRPFCENFCLQPATHCGFFGIEPENSCVAICMKFMTMSFAPMVDDGCGISFTFSKLKEWYDLEYYSEPGLSMLEGDAP